MISTAVVDISSRKQKRKSHDIPFQLIWSEKAKTMCLNLKRWELLLSSLTPSLSHDLSVFSSGDSFEMRARQWGWEFKIWAKRKGEIGGWGLWVDCRGTKGQGLMEWLSQQNIWLWLNSWNQSDFIGFIEFDRIWLILNF
jgi:hypothetical protein